MFSATALLGARWKDGPDSLVFQLRPVVSQGAPAGGRDAVAHLDEFFWERGLSPRLFVFAGKRKIINGVGIGRNPSNFFVQGKPQDRTLSDEDRRAEIEGDTMVGAAFFGPSYSLLSVMAARTEPGTPLRALLQANATLDAWAADISLTAYHAERPALGMNISLAAGEKTTWYVEAALRKGRDRPAPEVSASGFVIGAMPQDRDWIGELVLGGQYTTTGGITLNAEYWRNSNGYAGRELAAIGNSLSAGQGDTPLAAKMLAVPGLRQNSVFLRLSGIALRDSIKGEMTWIRSLDDSSGLWRGALVWDVGSAESLRLGIDHLAGSRFSEYGASKFDWRVFIQYKKHL